MHVGWLVDTYAYCLLGNHFHFLLRVRMRRWWMNFGHLTGAAENAGSLRPHLPGSEGSVWSGRSTHDQPPSQHFAHLFNAYVRFFNTCYGRTGALFQRPLAASR